MYLTIETNKKQNIIKVMKDRRALTLKTLNKSNVWDLQENDIFRLWESAEKDADLKDNMRHYSDIVRSAFDIEEIKIDKPEIIKKYEARGFKVGFVRTDESTKVKWAVKKRPILRVTDLTYENIRHITAAKLIEVLEISKGSWVEAIFAKAKPEAEKPRRLFSDEEKEEKDEEDMEIEDHYNDPDDEDTYDEDMLTEESYRTTYETNPEDLSLEEAEEISDEYDN